MEQYPDIKLTIDTGASRRIAGYFRLFGTYNTATGSKTTYAIEITKRYDLNDMLEEYTLEQIDEEEQQDHDKSSKVARDKTCKGLQYKRIHFIEKKVERMNNDCVGMRDIMTFLYYTAQRQVTDCCTAQNRTIYFNNNFYDPLPKSKLTDIFKYIDSTEVLKFKNETFLDWLNADEQERKDYSNMKQKPSGTRDMERKLNKEERDKSIKQFALQNKTNDEIALIVGCSKRTVVTVLKSNKLDKSEFLANQVKFLRLNYTQRQVAEMLNISLPTVKRYEKQGIKKCKNGS